MTGRGIYLIERMDKSALSVGQKGSHGGGRKCFFFFVSSHCAEFCPLLLFGDCDSFNLEEDSKGEAGNLT